MNNGQYHVQMWLRGMSAGLYVACAGLLHPRYFPITTTMLIVCWVIAGIYGKWRREEENRYNQRDRQEAEKDGGN